MRCVILVLFTVGCGGTTSATRFDAGPTDSAAADAPAEGEATEAPEAGEGGPGDAGCPSIAASDYDQTCTADRDCVSVGVGDICSAPCAFVCGIGGVIHSSDLPAYQADLARTGFSSTGIGCGCPSFSYGPCCVAGKCTFDGTCWTSSTDGGADAGASAEAGACPPGERLCAVGCSSTLACHATPCPPPPPCPPPSP